MATVNLVIDIGSSLTTIYKEGEGIVLHEPSVVIITGNETSYKMTDFGLDAYNQIPVLQPGHKVLYPIQEGAITYKKATLKMMEHFLGKIIARSDYFFKPKVRAFLNVPCGSGVEERKLFEEVLYAAGVDETFMLDAPIFAAYGAGVPITSRPELVVDIGGGIVDIALINNNGIIKGCSYGLGGIAATVANNTDAINRVNGSINVQNALQAKANKNTKALADDMSYIVTRIRSNGI